jgi:hypothetical protein
MAQLVVAEVGEDRDLLQARRVHVVVLLFPGSRAAARLSRTVRGRRTSSARLAND